MEAQLILGLCREFRCLPSQLLEEDASLLGLMALERMGREEDG